MRLLALITVFIPAVPSLLSSALAAQNGTGCPADLSLAKRISCYVERAQRLNDPAVCLGAEGPVRFQCISLYAERTKDPEPCALLTGSDMRPQTFHDTCVAGVAIAIVDPALCEQLETAKLTDSCLVQLVLERGADRSLCERVGTPFLKDACLRK